MYEHFSRYIDEVYFTAMGLLRQIVPLLFRNIGAHTSSASRAASAHSVFPHYVNYSTRRRQNQPFFRRIRRGIAQKEHRSRSVFLQVRLSPGSFTAEV